MDDELKSIQADLDGVLDRLEKYLRTDETPFDKPGTEWGKTEELASVVYRYIASDRRFLKLGEKPVLDNHSLLAAIRMTRIMHRDDAEHYDQHVRESGKGKGAILAALSAIVDRHVVAVPLPRRAVRELSEPAKRFAVLKTDKYFGEYGDQGLVRHSGKGAINRNQELIDLALMEVYMLCRDRPDKYTLRRATNKTDAFDEVASWHNYQVKPGTLERHWQRSKWPEMLRRLRSRTQ